MTRLYSTLGRNHTGTVPLWRIARSWAVKTLRLEEKRLTVPTKTKRWSVIKACIFTSIHTLLLQACENLFSQASILRRLLVCAMNAQN
jgi:hypothetical protein